MLYALQYKQTKCLSNLHPEKFNSHVNFRYLSDDQKESANAQYESSSTGCRSRFAYLEKQLVETIKVNIGGSRPGQARALPG